MTSEPEHVAEAECQPDPLPDPLDDVLDEALQEAFAAPVGPAAWPDRDSAQEWSNRLWATACAGMVALAVLAGGGAESPVPANLRRPPGRDQGTPPELPGEPRHPWPAGAEQDTGSQFN